MFIMFKPNIMKSGNIFKVSSITFGKYYREFHNNYILSQSTEIKVIFFTSGRGSVHAPRNDIQFLKDTKKTLKLYQSLVISFLRKRGGWETVMWSSPRVWSFCSQHFKLSTKADYCYLIYPN